MVNWRDGSGAAARRFSDDDRGAMTIFMLLMAVLLIGMLGLVVDSSRSFIAHSNMQNYVDDVALAAANELNGEPDAIQRAKDVVATSLLDKGTSVETAGGEIFSLDWMLFLSEAPKTTTSALSYDDFADIVTDDPELATHVLLMSEPRDVPWSALGIINFFQPPAADYEAYTVQTWAAATLVHDQSCAQPLLSVCLPAGVDPGTFDPGSQMQLTKNRDGNWQAGEYGIISNIPDDDQDTCAAYTGVDQLECLLAIDTHMTECGPTTVDFEGDSTTVTAVTAPDGNVITVHDDSINVHEALNTRFGIFDPNSAGYESSDRVSIDTNHISGEPFSCTGEVADLSSETQSLPRDECLADGSCGFMSDAVSRAELEAYWELAHGGSLPAVDWQGNPFETRYDVYRHEIASGLVDPEGGSSYGPRAECHAANAATDTKANRRVFEVAFVDCSGMGAVAQTEADVEAYAEVFLSEPAESTEYFVADFDHVIDITPNDGIDNPVAMAGGHAVTAKMGYDPYAAQGMRVHTLADPNGKNTPSLDYTPCAVGDFCAVFNNSNGFKLDHKKADDDALDFLGDLGLGDVEQIAVDESSGTNAVFDAGGIGETEGTWTSETPVQIVVFKAGTGFAVSVYETPRTSGEWTMEALGLVNNGGNPPDLSNFRAYSFSGTVPDSIITAGRHRGYNWPMLFDTQEGWAEDPDLESVGKGNVVIIPEHNRPSRPDDHANGGMIIFQFDEPTQVGSVVFFDGEEQHNKIKLYNEAIILEGVGSMTDPDQFDDLYEPDLVLDVPVIGDHAHRTFYIDSHPEYLAARAGGSIEPAGIRTMVYHLKGSGAIDEISFTNTVATQNRHDDVMVELLEVLDETDPRIMAFPVITN